jgi:hypothetical protein
MLSQTFSLCFNDLQWRAANPCDKGATTNETTMMTLGNMRENGMRSLSVACGALCYHHQAVLDVSAYANEVTVPSFGPRMVCTSCNAVGADARSNWSE